MANLKNNTRVLVQAHALGTIEGAFENIDYDEWDGDEPGVLYEVRLDKPIVPESGVPWSGALFSRKDVTPVGEIGDELCLTSDEMPQRITIEFDEQEAAGTIVIERGPYGLYIGIKEASDEPISLVDLFYKSSVGQGTEHGQYQIVLYDPAADTTDESCRVVFDPEGLRFEDGA